MPVPPVRTSARLGGAAAVGVALVIALGVAANFSPLRTPNDGVYYVAAARAFVETGAHVDATVIPYGLPVTRQNGIVYALAGMMSVAGDAWPVLYALVVTALWVWAVAAMARCYDGLNQPEGLKASGYRGWVLAAFTFFQYDLLNDSTSFMNEALYVPVFFALAAEVGRRLIGAVSRADVAAGLGELKPWLRVTGLGFVLVGLFFRNQHAVLLPLVATGCWLAGRRLLAIALPVGALAAFAVYAAWLPAPVTDGYFSTLAGAESIEASDLAYAAAMFTGPLSLTKVLPYGHPLTQVAALAMAVATMVGLQRMWRRHPYLATACALYMAGTLAFLVLLPFVSTRYYGLVNLPLIAAWAMLLPPVLPEHDVSVRWFAVPAAVVAVVVALYVRSYLSGEKHEQAYPQLQAHQRAADLVGQALVYSSQPRMAFWVLGVPACGSAPDDCAAARGLVTSRTVVFIGRADEWQGQDGLRGYRIARPLTVPAEGFAAWVMEAGSS